MSKFKLIFISYFLLELFFSLKVGEEIGFVFSVAWILFSMMIGIRLLKYSSYTMVEGFSSLNSGKLSLNSFRNLALSYMSGAILLIIPGVFSDFLGLLFICYTLYLQFIAKITPEKYNSTYTNFKNKGNDNETIIDVEIINECDNSNTLSQRK